MVFVKHPSTNISLYFDVRNNVLDNWGNFTNIYSQSCNANDFSKLGNLFEKNHAAFLRKINPLSHELDLFFLGGKDKFNNYFLKIDLWKTDRYWFLIKQPIINFLQSPNNSTFDDLACYDNDFFNLKLTKHVEEVRTKKRFDFQQLEFSFLPIIIGIAEELPYNDFYDELVFSEQIKFFHTIFYERLFQEHQIKIEDLDTYSLDWIKSKINEFHKYSTRNSPD